MRKCNWCNSPNVKNDATTCSPSCGAHAREMAKVIHAIASGKVRFTESGCWIWPDKSPSQYGPYKTFYRKLRGEIPKGLVPDHLCRNRPCVNPDHIELVTHKENTLRGTAPTAVNAHKTHCIRGHEFTEENTIWTKQGWRTCRTCKNAYFRALNKRTGDRHKGPRKPNRERDRARYLARRTERTCSICGAKYLGITGQTCSRKCRGKLSRL